MMGAYGFEKHMIYGVCGGTEKHRAGETTGELVLVLALVLLLLLLLALLLRLTLSLPLSCSVPSPSFLLVFEYTKIDY